ncbi:MAG: glycosyltransferase [Verrucomicrobiota bacterium]
MRLTQIVPSLDPSSGGPSISVPSLSAALARLGHEVELLATHAPDSPASRIAEPARVKMFPRGWPAMLQRSSALRRYLDKNPGEVVHHHALWLPTLHYAHRAARRAGAKFVISPRGMMSGWAWRHHAMRKRVARALIHPGAFEAADGWHATSEEEADDIRLLGFKQPICVAPNGVEAPAPESIVAAREHWRAACPAVQGRRVALFYSRFHPKKRVLELIDLWLATAPADWLLLLVGIPERYSVHDLEGYVRRASAQDRIRVFDGSSVPPPYAVASLFLLPSHSENFGLVVAEALAHGVPALVTDTTPWRGLPTAQGGWCVPFDSFAATLKEACALSDDDLRARGLRGQAWVLSHFSWEASARRLSDFYPTLRATA